MAKKKRFDPSGYAGGYSWVNSWARGGSRMPKMSRRGLFIGLYASLIFVLLLLIAIKYFG